jgi:hypothetical protein
VNLGKANKDAGQVKTMDIIWASRTFVVIREIGGDGELLRSTNPTVQLGI